ncbi:MAG: peptidoglycan-binding domain-containing protein [Hyphomicrobiales bacterium]
MPATVRVGSAGVDVQVAQAQLNLGYPNRTALVLDGLFGPITREKTVQFQRDRGLSADAIIGPITWAALGRIKYDPHILADEGGCCNADPSNKARGQRLALAFRGGALQQTALPSAGHAVATASSSVTIAGYTVLPLKGSKYEPIARSVYGSSLHYDRIFLSDGKGLDGRAFAIVVPVPPGVIPSLPSGGAAQVLNIGTSPKKVTLIHELGHAWQSQHASDSAAYMANCLACQGAAVAANKVIGAVDPTVKSHSRFPVNYPMSAYAYRPGSAFETYAGEQIATQIEKSEVPIVAHVKGVSAGSISQPNEKSLSIKNIKIEDRRAPGVKM